MTTNWIKWKDRAPTEADLPIECAEYGGKCCYTFESFPSFSGWDLWRPYICDIPKAEEVKESSTIVISMKDGTEHRFKDGVANFAIIGPPISFGKKPTPIPDANGWWRIEDRKPEKELEIKFERKGDAHTYIGIVDRFTTDRVEAIGLKGLVPFDDIEKWCPLDMTGPEMRLCEFFNTCGWVDYNGQSNPTYLSDESLISAIEKLTGGEK